jgi:hypothetical protein
MARQRKANQLTADDFGWLELANYAELEKGDLRLWSAVLHDRAELNRFLIHGDKAFVAMLFEKLQAAPLAPLGFEVRSLPQHPASQSTVKLLTLGNQAGLTGALELQAEGRQEAHRTAVESHAHPTSSSIDEIIQQSDSAWDRYAHLRLDLRATDECLKDDFARLLRAWRTRKPIDALRGNNLQKKATTWGTRGLVPYFDMQMHARLAGKEVPRPVVIAKLTRTVQTSRGKLSKPPSTGALDELQKDLPRIFSPTQVDILRNAISDG